MKRYLLFVGSRYYPEGGWGDFKGDFATKGDAEKKMNEEIDDGDYILPWAHVIDQMTGLIALQANTD